MASVKICGQAVGCSLPQYLKVLLRRNFDFFFFFYFRFSHAKFEFEILNKKYAFSMHVLRERASFITRTKYCRKEDPR